MKSKDSGRALIGRFDILWVEQFYAAPWRFNPQYLLQIENIDVKNFNL